MRVYKLRVYPKGLGRDVYRTFTLSGTANLNDLCNTILAYFHFTQEHLFLFDMTNSPLPFKSRDRFESKTSASCGGLENPPTLDALQLRKGKNILFLYDFGDDWNFIVHVVSVNAAEAPGLLLKSKGEVVQYPNNPEF